MTFGEHRLMVRPRESFDQRVLSFQLTTNPGAGRVRHLHDAFGNCVSSVRLERASEVLSFESRVSLARNPQTDFPDCDEVIGPGSPPPPFEYEEDAPDLLRCAERVFPDPDQAVDQWVRRFLRWTGPTPAFALLGEMTGAIHADFTYRRRLEKGVQTPAETLASKSGTCRDFAVLMIEAARAVGLAAHFVSGYIYVPNFESEGRVRVGGGHTHAWGEVYLPSCGWIEFDPTNGLIGNGELVRVAAVRHPRQAIPLWGSFDGSPDDFIGMEVEIDLQMERERALDVA